MEQEEFTCAFGAPNDGLEHDNIRQREYKYGWNGYEMAYEETLDVCDECDEVYRSMKR